jgi:hypothetical protein
MAADLNGQSEIRTFPRTPVRFDPRWGFAPGGAGSAGDGGKMWKTNWITDFTRTAL